MKECIFEYDDGLDMTFTDCGCDYDGDVIKQFNYCPNCGDKIVTGKVDLLDRSVKDT